MKLHRTHVMTGAVLNHQTNGLPIMIFDPEVLTPRPSDINFNLDKQLTISQPRSRPAQRLRVIHIAVSQSSIRCPHDFLQLPELGKETRESGIL
jgi:hypothetical protein